MATFTSIATRYNELYRFMFEPMADLVVKYLPLDPDDHLADVGGGTGAISHLVWKKAGECSESIRVDHTRQLTE